VNPLAGLGIKRDQVSERAADVDTNSPRHQRTSTCG
jgi:hypothetical protein